MRKGIGARTPDTITEGLGYAFEVNFPFNLLMVQ